MREHNMKCSTSRLLAVLEATGCGAAIASTEGMILTENPSAEKILRAIRQHHMTGAAPGQLSRKFMAMLEANAPKPVSLGLVGPRPYVARKFPVDPGSAHFLLICVDLNTTQVVQPEWLRYVFGLTHAEALLAAQLCTGAALRDIAAKRGIGVGTLRGQLKSIFAKTGTSRQPALVAMLSRLACLTEVADPPERI
jgi:DNA-binding CsgD family transcriptional regulator